MCFFPLYLAKRLPDMIKRKFELLYEVLIQLIFFPKLSSKTHHPVVAGGQDACESLRFLSSFYLI